MGHPVYPVIFKSICCCNLRFVLKHLPGNISNKEIEDMINTVDKNKDGKISYSEFRVSGV